ncbi:hypothetical protein G7Y79_00033g068550 [Physcia stellaris]|nr:hypothetical protein G7Y79_00033g068550 [Physcia stellaris]
MDSRRLPTDIGESEKSDSDSVPWNGGQQLLKVKRARKQLSPTKRARTPPPKKMGDFDMIYHTREHRENCISHIRQTRGCPLATRVEGVTPPDIPIARLKRVEDNVIHLSRALDVEIGGLTSLDQSVDDSVKARKARNTVLLDQFHLMLEKATAVQNGQLDEYNAQCAAQLQRERTELELEKEAYKRQSKSWEEKAAQDTATIEDLQRQLTTSRSSDKKKGEELAEQNVTINEYTSSTHRLEKVKKKLEKSEDYWREESKKQEAGKKTCMQESRCKDTQLASLNQELDETKHWVASLQAQVKTSKEGKAQNERSLLASESKIAELEQDKQNLSTTVGQSTLELKKIKDKLEVALQSKIKYKTDCQEYKVKADRTFKQMTERGTEMSGLIAKAKEQAKELENARQKLREAEAVVAAEKERLEEANETISSLEIVSEQRLDSIHALRSRLDKTEADSRQKATQLKRKSEDLKEAKEKVSTLEGTAKQQQTILTDLTRTWEQSKIDLSNTQGKLKTKSDDLKETKDKWSTMESNVRHQRRQITELTSTLEKANRDLSDTQAELEKTSDRLIKQQDDYVVLQVANLASSKDYFGRINRYERDLKNTRRQSEKSLQDVQRLETTIGQLEETISGNSAKIDKLTTERGAAANQVKDYKKRVRDYEIRVRDYETRVKDSEKMIKSYDKRINRLDADIDILKKEKQELTRSQDVKLAHLRDESSKLTLSVNSKIESLDRKVKAIQDTSHDLSLKQIGIQQNLQLCQKHLEACRTQRLILADSLTVADDFKRTSDCILESGQSATLWMCRTSLGGSCIFFLKSEEDSLLVTCAPSECAWSDAEGFSLNIARPDGERMMIRVTMDLFEAYWFEKLGCVYVMDDIQSWQPATAGAFSESVGPRLGAEAT